MKILNFGSCNIDYTYTLEHFVRAGETISSHMYAISLGGKGFNQSMAMAKSGLSLFHAGCVGADGERVRQTLQDHGVDVRYLRQVEEATGHAIIQVTPEGENCIIIYGGANRCVSRDYVDEVLEDFGQDDILVLQNEISHLSYVMDVAQRKGMKMIFNPSPMDDSIKNMDFGRMYAVVINETEGLELTGESDPECILDAFQKKYQNLKVILTLGKMGSMYLDCATGERFAQAAFQVPVVDTTAAGDSFSGYLVYGIAQGMPAKDMMRLASLAASMATSRKGAADSIPRMEEVRQAMQTLVPYDDQ